MSGAKPASLLLLALLTLSACGESPSAPIVEPPTPPKPNEQSRTAAFLVVDGVYNSELMAPYDVLHHSIFRDSLDYILPFVVSPDGNPVETFEGLTVSAHYSFENAPPVNILIIPSAEGSMSSDLGNERLINWIRETATTADWVITVCDGAFTLAATGLLDGRTATTFPSDRDALAEMFPEIDVGYDERIVVDGKFITSVGGAMSYEPALYLVEHIYGPEHARLTAEGLVWPWNVEAVPLFVVDPD